MTVGARELYLNTNDWSPSEIEFANRAWLQSWWRLPWLPILNVRMIVLISKKLGSQQSFVGLYRCLLPWLIASTPSSL